MSLSVTALTKQYGGSTALNRLSVTFEPNVIYGLFGRNGAGKSTLLGCIGNRLIPDTGRIVLEAYRRRSRTIVIATHEIAEFADILERAVIIDQGRRIDSFEVQDLCSHAALLVGPSDVVRAYAAGRGLRVLDVEHRGRFGQRTGRHGLGIRAGGWCIRVRGRFIRFHHRRTAGWRACTNP